ncbi:MAG: 16S rRNA (guanine(527)-N(7))-methyltransferase RsmG [Planctomycetota bacterium]|jgi:16S rRNA (guanine527-N7)-methyltransferase
MAKRNNKKSTGKKNSGKPAQSKGKSSYGAAKKRRAQGKKRGSHNLLERVPFSKIKKKDPRKKVEKRDPDALLIGCEKWNSEKPSPTLMKKIFADCGFELDDLKINLFWQFYLRLKERNKEINITRIHKFDDTVVRHFVDCIIVGKYTKLPSPILDIGSGGGFPGVPLKIVNPDTEIILGEGRKLRVEFLEEVRKCLRLPKLYIYGHQIHPSFTDPINGAITRAVEVVPKTLARVRGGLQKGGRVILMKGPKVDPELEEAAKTFKDEYKLIEDHAFVLPGTDHKRRVVVYERLIGPEEQE